jgi:hypothetical protein
MWLLEMKTANSSDSYAFSPWISVGIVLGVKEPGLWPKLLEAHLPT